MSGQPSVGRCKHTFPKNQDINTAVLQNCCWREIAEGENRCIWHVDSDESNKTAEKLREARAPAALRDQTSPPNELLDGAQLSGIKLNDAVAFDNVALRNADFSGAVLQEADFSGAILQEADFSDADLKGANFSGAVLQGANLSGADLQKTDFSGAFLNEADLSDALLGWADLSGARLEKVTLSNADLREATLSNADLREADLSDANLWRANSSYVTLSGSVLTDADFTNVRLTSADLRRSDLTGAVFNQADLSGADLRGAVLEGSFLDDAILTNIKIRGSAEAHKAAERSTEIYNSIRRVIIVGLMFSITAIFSVLFMQEFGILLDSTSNSIQIAIIISLIFLFVYGWLARKFLELRTNAERVVEVGGDG
jgi:uncharacterized protein YjbI with pentapeptide repeats